MRKLLSNRKVIAGFSAIAVVFGTWYLFTEPARVAARALTEVKNLHTLGQAAVAELQTKFSTVQHWYTPERAAEVSTPLQEGVQWLAKAEAEITSAEQAAATKERRASTASARQLLDSCAVSLKRANDKLVELETLTILMKRQLSERKMIDDSYRQHFADLTIRLQQEGPQYLAKYVSEQEQLLKEASDQLNATSATLETITAALPYQGDTKQNLRGKTSAAIL